MNIATLAALLKGDIENAIISATPGGIQAQEAAGQRSFVANTYLPKDMRGDRHIFEAMGIVFGEQVDDLFVEAQLPPGWKKVATGHSMWSHLVDERGRERASIFYKAAFYDRSAHINPSRRFWFGHTYKGEIFAHVSDSSGVLWRTESIGPEPEYERGSDTPYALWHEQRDKLDRLAKDWLNTNYPDWQNPLAYWD